MDRVREWDFPTALLSTLITTVSRNKLYMINLESMIIIPRDVKESIT